ncbi:MAG: tRNA lysidine(34) synthetase TilS [Desulfobacterales bacterium]|jgi:tRNA(Ile)-lysidine synthase
MPNIEEKILSKVEHTLITHRMVQTGDTVLVGVSGGPDSVALVDILLALGPKFSFKVAIAHLNHCLRRDESKRDEDFVVSLAEQLDLPLHVERQDVRHYQKSHRLSLEEAARQVRYRFYDAIASKFGYEKIALGHHSDDNAELILMYLLRGSGPLGLSGIPPLRDAKIIRPLIDIKRSEIMDYIALRGLDCVLDSSNRDSQYLRNRVRNRLIPELKAEYNPKLIDSLNRLALILDAEQRWIESLIQPIFKKVVVFEKQSRIGFDIEQLNQHNIAVRRLLIRRAVLKVKGNLRRLAFVHVEAAIKLAQKTAASGALDLPDRIRISRQDNVLIISKEAQNLRHLASAARLTSTPDYAYRLSKTGELFIKEAALKIRFSEIPLENTPDWRPSGQGASTVYFDMDKIRFPLVIRNFRPGDRFSPLGMTGRQKLNKFFIDHKVSRADRKKCPILLSRNEIIWVVGHRLDNAAKMGPQTRRILKAEVLLA